MHTEDIRDMEVRCRKATFSWFQKKEIIGKKEQ